MMREGDLLSGEEEHLSDVVLGKFLPGEVRLQGGERHLRRAILGCFLPGEGFWDW